MQISGTSTALPPNSDSTPVNNTETWGKRKVGRPKKTASTKIYKVGKPKEYIVKFLIHQAYKGINAYCWADNSYPMIIKVINTQGLAKEWGAIKNKPQMNYQKLSRALRHYNHNELIQNDRRNIYIPDLDNQNTRRLLKEASNEYKRERNKNTIL